MASDNESYMIKVGGDNIPDDMSTASYMRRVQDGGQDFEDISEGSYMRIPAG